MKLRMLCLDDKLETLKQPIDAVFGPLLTVGEIPLLQGGVAQAFQIRGFGQDSIDVEIVSNTHNDPERVAAEIATIADEGRFDLVLVDDDWGQFGSTEGQSRLLPVAMKILKGPCAELPTVVLFTQHWDQTERVQSLCSLMNQFASEQARVTGLHKTDASGLMLLVQRVLTERRIAEERDAAQNEVRALRKRLAAGREVAHGSLGLMSYVRDLVGIEGFLIEFAQVIQDFFEWQSSQDEELPGEIGWDFNTAVLLEGEPGAGKSSVCRAVARAFNSQNTALPKHLGPLQSRVGWEAPLRTHVVQFYTQAQRERKVVVIQADDLVWPSPATMSDGMWGATWTAYLNCLRECIEDAARINAGQRPQGAFARSLRHPFCGKIMWLFARNGDEDVGPMFEPLRQKLLTLHLEFPKAVDDRRDILRYRASAKGISFAKAALDGAVQATRAYSGRDLLGDDTGRGFLRYAINRVKTRERARHRKGEAKLQMVITPDIVDEWLASREHTEIARRLAQPQPLGSHSREHPDGSLASRFDEVARSKARQYLDKWDQGCKLIPAGEEVTLMRLAAEFNETGPNISGHITKYGEVMFAFMQEFPNAWSCLRTRTNIETLCQRRKKP